jgi:general stress protein CsbA
MVLWIAIVLISMIGLGANVYKANTGAEIEWPSTIAEIVCLLAAGLFIFDKLRKKHKEQEEDNK